MKSTAARAEAWVIGSGTGIPYERRRPPAVAVRLLGHLLLFDCGAGTLWGLAQAGLDYRELDSVWLSHFHPDHTGDLASLLFAARSPLYGRKRPIILGGALGLKDFYRGLRRLYGRWVELEPGLLGFEEIMPGDAPASMNLPVGRLTTLAMAHTPQSLGYRLESDDGLVVAYSGDTDYCANAVALAQNADLFFCECSFPDHLKKQGHLSPRWAGRLAREAGCRRLILVHLYPACDQGDVVAACGQEYAGEIVLAEDLMRFRL